jgi:hypothetical protein
VTTTFTFAPATREQARARIGLQGPAGCGKTKSALRIAEGLAQGGPIGLIDTERRSALTYAVVPGQPHLGGHEFGHMPMDSYDPRNLIKAVHAAEQAGIVVLIVDSWSHYWIGRGGLLEIVNQSGSDAGSFGGWKKGNPIEQDMLDALLNYSGHLIVTMRTKTDYVIDKSGTKTTITKVGTKTVQREGTDYELGLIIDMIEGTGTVTKTRYEPLEGVSIHHPGEDLGRQILELLGQGVDPVQAIVDELRAADLTYAAALDLHARAKQRHLLDVEAAHPKTGEVMTLGAAIAAVGSALKPAAAPAPEPSAPEPSPAPSVEPEQPPAAERPGPADGSGATAPQMRKIHALMNALKLPAERGQQLAAISLLLRIPHISSRNELTFGQASALIEELGHWEKREDGPAALRAHIDGLAGQQPAAGQAPAA